MATIRDVARESGVSVATVSYVLNNGPRPVREDTRERVTATMRRLNFHPNAVARSLVRRSTNCIGVLFGDVEPTVVTNYYVSGVLAGIFAKAQEREYDVRLFTSFKRDGSAEHSLQAQQPDGMIVLAPPTSCRMAERLSVIGVPTVLVSTPEVRDSIPFVDVDNVLGARLAVEHLIGLGHRRIAHVMGNPSQYSAVVRRDTFEAVLLEHGLVFSEENIVGSSFDQKDVYESVYQALQRPNRPTAFFAANDGLALSTMNAARDSGLRVPEDISVIGHDDFPIAEYLTPALTTIRQPMLDIGISATSMLFDQFENKEIVKEQLLPPKLIVRGSTAIISPGEN